MLITDGFLSWDFRPFPSIFRHHSAILPTSFLYYFSALSLHSEINHKPHEQGVLICPLYIYTGAKMDGGGKGW
ncbi:MAG: hypothetical protein IIW42_08665 [Bacteroidaceae bacterium]|nr:hypothetical protein [Bacteroidaceae bacterium]MBQ5840074.1 hypothetical protein [Bacteroidaceae bacterium]